MKLAVMKLERGEEMVASMMSGHISGTGRYKLIAKKRIDGLIEWAHFTERDNGLRENVYRGEVKDARELETVMMIMNKHLKKVFGDHAEMNADKPGIVRKV